MKSLGILQTGALLKQGLPSSPIVLAPLMAETYNYNTNDESSLDLQAVLTKVMELQEALLQAQEKNLLLSAQTRELERVARDVEDLKTELTNQSVLLTDKSRENKQLHQELAKVASLLESKLQESEDLRTTVADLQHQLRTRESERDLLAVMLNEAEQANRKPEDYQQQTSTNKEAGWLKHFKKA